MNEQEYKLIAGAIGRTQQANNLEGNAVKRAGRQYALRLLTIDLTATLAHNYPKTFDREKFLKACGYEISL